MSIHTSKAQTSIPASHLDWHNDFNAEEWSKQGEMGFVIAGKVVSIRPHSVTTKTDVLRYIALVVDCDTIHKRVVDRRGVEVEPKASANYGATQVKGYLSVDRSKGEDANARLPSDVEEALKKVIPAKVMSARNKAVSVKDGILEFWCTVAQGKDLDLHPDDKVRFRTLGDTLLMFNIARNDGKLFSNYSGGAVLDQMSGMAAKKRDDEDLPLQQDMVEGVDDDEWSD
eukprot:TRINITY_DN5359_c0_g1_i1.p1 TRINITY_DN5359_c0_g1~~TRINITY_DN5359_c0_g1_i1.p1  ORF type:complete len:228 (-),score=58.53 TRINITY_DN5359_c0_g1_i1:35-718(-)